jgi:hypothetical protein
MKIECGPSHDIRTFELEIPVDRRLGMMISGGIDSTILYYLLLYARQQYKPDTFIRPFSIKRKDGSKRVVGKVIDEVNKLFGIENVIPSIVGDTSLPEIEQVKSAVIQAWNLLGPYPPFFPYVDIVYIGSISVREEHLFGYIIPEIIETENVKFPLLHLEKSHVIDLYYRMGVEHLLQYTYSCVTDENIHCGYCNGCVERAWGFEQLNKKDPRI